MADTDTDWRWMFTRIWIFIKYIIWEPFRQIAKPRAWMYVFLVIFFVTLLRGKKLEQIISFFILIFLLLWTEWESGKFMEEFRKKTYGKFYKRPEKKKSP